MFTINFDNLITGKLISYSVSKYGELTEETATNCLCIKDYYGKVYDYNSCPEDILAINTTTNSISSSSNFVTMYFGSNDAEESYYDYTVDLISTITTQSYTGYGKAVDDGVPYVYVRKTIKNSGEETITINEVGIFTNVTFKSSSTSSRIAPVLMYRKKFDEPIVIEAGALAEVSIKIELYPMNKPTTSSGSSSSGNDYDTELI